MEKNKVKLFIDETSHLEHDGHHNMCIGYIQVPDSEYITIRNDIKSIKLNYFSPTELKWSKFSKSRLSFYKALVDYFFDSQLSFRCVLIRPKDRLDNEQFNQGKHDNFYYKMIYYLVKNSVRKYQTSIFIDIKDTRGREKIRKITEVFQSKMKIDAPFERMQHLRSEHNEFIQLVDFFIGAISYNARVKYEKLPENQAKLEFLSYLENKAGFDLNNGTPPWETKFNIFDFQPRKH